jgi:hypothetical protein
MEQFYPYFYPQYTKSLQAQHMRSIKQHLTKAQGKSGYRISTKTPFSHSKSRQLDPTSRVPPQIWNGTPVDRLHSNLRKRSVFLFDSQVGNIQIVNQPPCQMICQPLEDIF